MHEHRDPILGHRSVQRHRAGELIDVPYAPASLDVAALIGQQ